MHSVLKPRTLGVKAYIINTGGNRNSNVHFNILIYASLRNLASLNCRFFILYLSGNVPIKSLTYRVNHSFGSYGHWRGVITVSIINTGEVRLTRLIFTKKQDPSLSVSDSYFLLSVEFRLCYEIKTICVFTITGFLLVPFLSGES